MNTLFSWLSIPRMIGIWIDSIAFSLIDNVYDLIVFFASNEIFTSDMYNDVKTNTYVIISIFALFRIALLLINSLINPDKLFDSGAGLGKIAQNVVIMFVILIVTPSIFGFLRDIQKTIVNGNYIGKIFSSGITNFGENASSDGYSPGDMMKKIAVGALIYPDKRLDTGGICESACTGNCKKAIEDYKEMMEGNNGNNKVDFGLLSTYATVSVDCGDEEVYAYHYFFIVTLGVGVFITYILLSFAIDIALRTVELAVLEILSPIFIASYVDPKSAKSGAFKNWLETVGKTYASLFIKLAIISIMLYLVYLLSTEKVINNLFKGGVFATLFMLLAVLIFAKKAPKWIMGLIGMKGEEGLGGLSIGKKLAGAALVGGAASAGINAAKNKVKNGAKKAGLRTVNRIGADIGGTIAGRGAAKEIAKGDNSLKNIRDKKLAETGSRYEANKAMFKSFFNKDDYEKRRDAVRIAREAGKIGEAGIKSRQKARIDASDAAISGKFASAITLGQNIKQDVLPNYQTRDQKIRSNLEARYYATPDAFDRAEINRQKKIKQDLEESRRILGVQTYANAQGDIFLDSGFVRPAIYNEKTAKKYIGEYATSLADYGVHEMTFGNKNVILTNAEREVVVGKDNQGNDITGIIPAGALIRPATMASDGYVGYRVLMSSEPIMDKNQNAITQVCDKNGNMISVTGGDIVGKDGVVRKMEKTTSGFELKDSTGKTTMSLTENKDSAGNVIGMTYLEVETGRTGQVLTKDLDENETLLAKVMSKFGESSLGGVNSPAVKHLDSAFASILQQNAGKVMSYESRISESKNQIIELQNKLTQQQNAQLLQLDATPWGANQKKLGQLQEKDKQMDNQLSVISSILLSGISTGGDNISYQGQQYSISDLKTKQSQIKITKQKNQQSIIDLNNWFSNNAGEKTKFDSLVDSLDESLKNLKEAIDDEKGYVESLENEKNKLCESGALIFKGKVITSANYENYKDEIQKDVDKKKKIAEGSVANTSAKSSS